MTEQYDEESLEDYAKRVIALSVVTNEFDSGVTEVVNKVYQEGKNSNRSIPCPRCSPADKRVLHKLETNINTARSGFLETRFNTVDSLNTLLGAVFGTDRDINNVSLRVLGLCTIIRFERVFKSPLKVLEEVVKGGVNDLTFRGWINLIAKTYNNYITDEIFIKEI
jgi:hypothetical protein